MYMIEDHPLPWLQPLLNGVEHANFFETRATEYSKGATTGDWNTVWSSFDKRQKAKAVNEDGPVEAEAGLFWRLRLRSRSVPQRDTYSVKEIANWILDYADEIGVPGIQHGFEQACLLRL